MNLLPSENHHYKKAIEALLMASDEPLPIEKLAAVFQPDIELSMEEIKMIIESLKEDYQERGIELKQLASGYTFQTHQDYACWVSRLWQEKPPRYSRALLETLAIIAYRQPVTRPEIEAIRGVAVSANIMKTLLEREWIRVMGYRDVPGKPSVYGTTKYFLDYFNLDTLEDLPKLESVSDVLSHLEKIENMPVIDAGDVETIKTEEPADAV